MMSVERIAHFVRPRTFMMDLLLLRVSKLRTYSSSVRADNRSYRLSAPIWAICRYIGFADKQNAYRHRLSVSADKDPYIGNLSNMLNYIWPLGGW